MGDLSTLSDDELSRRTQAIEAENRRRWDERKNKEIKESEENFEKFRKLLTPEAVNLFAPSHLTSCSDDNLENGFGAAENGSYRCLRCALQDIALNSWSVYGEQVIDIELRIETRYL